MMQGRRKHKNLNSFPTTELHWGFLSKEQCSCHLVWTFSRQLGGKLWDFLCNHCVWSKQESLCLIWQKIYFGFRRPYTFTALPRSFPQSKCRLSAQYRNPKGLTGYFESVGVAHASKGSSSEERHRRAVSGLMDGSLTFVDLARKGQALASGAGGEACAGVGRTRRGGGAGGKDGRNKWLPIHFHQFFTSEHPSAAIKLGRKKDGSVGN